MVFEVIVLSSDGGSVRKVTLRKQLITVTK